MILELPLTADPAQTFTCQLGDIKYFIQVRFNSRSGVWTLDLLDDATRVLLLAGAPIVLGVDILEACNFGIGSLIAVDLSSTGLDATVEDLGTRVALFWVSPDEVL